MRDLGDRSSPPGARRRYDLAASVSRIIQHGRGEDRHGLYLVPRAGCDAPAAVLEATLENISRADAPVEVMGKVRIDAPGNAPTRIEIPCDASRIDPRYLYSVRARVTVGERLLFTTDQVYPVLTRGASDEVSLLLHQVPRAPTAPRQGAGGGGGG